MDEGSQICVWEPHQSEQKYGQCALFFDNFQKAPTSENYIDGLVKSMAGLSMSAAPVTPKLKRWLVDMDNSNEEQDDIEIPKKKKKTKKSKKL